MTEQERDLIRDAMMFAVKDMTGRVMREATVQSMIDDFKKSIDYKTVFPSDLQIFLDSLDNTEREGLESDLKDDGFKYTEENPYIATMVGGDTGVNLPMRKIFKMLKDANYNPRITKGNKLTGISDIEIGVGDDNFSAGLLLITKNGQTFGDDLWGKDIKSETEIFPLIDEYYKDQLEAEKERE